MRTFFNHAIACVVNGSATIFAGVCSAAEPSIAVNQHAFEPAGPKLAVVSTPHATPLEWTLFDAAGAPTASGLTAPFGRSEAAGQNVHRLAFSQFNEPGEAYTLVVEGVRSYPFSIESRPFQKLKYDALAFFYHQRASTAIDAELVGEIWARPEAHNPDVAECVGPKDFRGNEWGGCPYTLDVSHGWYDAGDHGKYVVNGGIAVWTILNYYERIRRNDALAAAFADGSMAIPERSNEAPDILDEARWQLDFLFAMQVPDGSSLRLPRGDQRGNVQKLRFETVDASGMAHHKMHDERWTALPMPPHKDTEKRVLSYPSTAATLNLAAVAAQAARLWEDVDADYAGRALSVARSAYDAAKRLPDVLAYDVTEGGGGGYGDADVSDEFYWAAVELFLTTGEPAYREDVLSSRHFLAAPSADGSGAGDISWASVQALGTLSLLAASASGDAVDLQQAREVITSAARRYLAEMNLDGYGVPFKRSYVWGSNADMANRGIILAAAYDITGEASFRDGAISIMDYLLGRNPLGQSYISGYGENPMKRPHHRFWANSIDEDLPPPPPGVLAGGPNNQNPADPVAKRIIKSCAAQTCYRDEVEAYSLNEVAINWNAPLFWLAAFLDEPVSQ